MIREACKRHGNGGRFSHRWLSLAACAATPTRSDRRAWISAADHLGRLTPGDNRTGCDHRIDPDRYARRHERLGSNPRAVRDGNGLVAVWHIGLPIIVAAGAQKCALRNAALRSDSHRFKIQDENLLPDPRVITDGQLPGEVNVHSRLDPDASADRCPEGP